MGRKQPFVIHVNEMSKFPDAVYIGRAIPARHLVNSIWRNPFKISKSQDRAEVIRLFREYLYAPENKHLLASLKLLDGRPLACWCRFSHEEPYEGNCCHGDILIEAWRKYRDYDSVWEQDATGNARDW